MYYNSIAIVNRGKNMLSVSDVTKYFLALSNNDDGDLISNIEVDLTSLVDFHTSISVGDIQFPDTITVLDDPELMVASVSAPREEEPEEEIVSDAVEGVEGAEDTEGEEGKEESSDEKSEG